MNARLKTLSDGTGRDGVVWFNVSHRAGRRQDFGEIYWPFAVHQTAFAASGLNWRVTHLPTGRSIADALSYRRALSLTKGLRKLGIDWTFTKMNASWAAQRHIVKAYLVRRGVKIGADGHG